MSRVKKKESSFPRARLYEFVPFAELEFREISLASRFSHGNAKSSLAVSARANAR